jgi:hypothetical protein
MMFNDEIRNVWMALGLAVAVIVGLVMVGCNGEHFERRTHCDKGAMYNPGEGWPCQTDVIGWKTYVAEQTGRVYCVCEGGK